MQERSLELHVPKRTPEASGTFTKGEESFRIEYNRPEIPLDGDTEARNRKEAYWQRMKDSDTESARSEVHETLAAVESNELQVFEYEKLKPQEVAAKLLQTADAVIEVRDSTISGFPDDIVGGVAYGDGAPYGFVENADQEPVFAEDKVAA